MWLTGAFAQPSTDPQTEEPPGPAACARTGAQNLICLKAFLHSRAGGQDFRYCSGFLATTIAECYAPSTAITSSTTNPASLSRDINSPRLKSENPLRAMASWSSKRGPQPLRLVQVI